jgi:hypothetical protein
MGIDKRGLTWLHGSEAPKPQIVLCNASYEGRCLSVALQVRTDELEVALVGVNDNLRTHVGENAEKLRALFGSAAQMVVTDSTQPLITADAWMAALRKIAGQQPRHFLCDITTFTHESLLILLKLLGMHMREGDSCLFAYSGAAEYDSPRKGHEKWLSKGVQDVRTVLGYPGVIRPSQRTHLIILVGYEHERATRLIQVFEPNRVSLGKSGDGTSTDEKHQASNEKFHQLASEMAKRYAPVETFEFPCNDPWGAQAAVLTQASRFKDYNVVVAPMNTKISTVGCALAASANESIQLCYAQPIRYNYAHYSTPGESCYLFTVPEIARLCREDETFGGVGN